MLDSSANSRWGRSLISDVNLARCAKIDLSIIQDALVTFTASMLSRPDRGRRLEFASATRLVILPGILGWNNRGRGSKAVF